MNFSERNVSHGDIFTEVDHSVSTWITAVKIMRYVCIPVIACVGFCGNTLSLLVFSARSMRRSSCSVFLAALAAVDNVFLISLVISWIDGHIRTLLTLDFACETLVYMTYVASFLSAWFIVGFTCERYIAICFPLRSHYLCSVFREKVTVYVLTIIALVAYNYSFWTTVSSPVGGCLHRLEYIQFLNIVTWIDTLFTMVLPFLIIAIVNSLVFRAVSQCTLKSGDSKTRKIKVKRSLSSPEVLDRSVISLRSSSSLTLRLPGTSRVNHRARVTRTLLFVSSTFLMLNLPAHVLRLYNLIAVATSNVPAVSDKLYFLQELTATLYYATFGCNFFIYTLFGRNFKHTLFRILRCKSTALNVTSRQIVFRRFSYNRQSTRSSCLTSL